MNKNKQKNELKITQHIRTIKAGLHSWWAFILYLFSSTLTNVPVPYGYSLPCFNGIHLLSTQRNGKIH